MIEGINPSTAGANTVSNAVIQEAVLASNPAPVPVPQESIDTNFIPSTSLVTALDPELNTAIRQVRDNNTGDIIRTIPSDAQIQAYQRSLSGDSFTGFIPITLRDNVAAEVAVSSPDQTSIEVETNTEEVASSDISAPVSVEPVDITIEGSAPVSTNIASVDLSTGGTSAAASATPSVDVSV